MQLCAITARQRLYSAAGAREEVEANRRRQLRALVRDWIEGGVDFVQLREKDLAPGEICSLAKELLAGLDRRRLKLLVNLRASDLLVLKDDFASLFALADGIHLPGKPASENAYLVRQAFRRVDREGLVSMSCHSIEEILAARQARANLVFYAPVFEKAVPGGEGAAPDERSRTVAQGLGALTLACAAAGGMPVFALGGINAANAAACQRAGAAGVAGIRLFQQGDWRRLERESSPGSQAGTIYS